MNFMNFFNDHLAYAMRHTNGCKISTPLLPENREHKCTTFPLSQHILCGYFSRLYACSIFHNFIMCDVMCCVLIVCIRVVVFHWLFMIQVSRSKQLYFAAIETFLKCAQQSVCASVCIALLYLTQAHTLCCCAVYFENCLLVYLTILAAICSWIHMNEYNMCWVAYMRVFVVLCTWCAIHWTEHY